MRHCKIIEGDQLWPVVVGVASIGSIDPDCYDVTQIMTDTGFKLELKEDGELIFVVTINVI